MVLNERISCKNVIKSVSVDTKVNDAMSTVIKPRPVSLFSVKEGIPSVDPPVPKPTVFPRLSSYHLMTNILSWAQTAEGKASPSSITISEQGFKRPRDKQFLPPCC